jgi:hypothetical protein
MNDALIAAIARRVAATAAFNAYERSTETAKHFKDALTELCAAVRAETAEQTNDSSSN